MWWLELLLIALVAAPLLWAWRMAARNTRAGPAPPRPDAGDE